MCVTKKSISRNYQNTCTLTVRVNLVHFSTYTQCDARFMLHDSQLVPGKRPISAACTSCLIDSTPWQPPTRRLAHFQHGLISIKPPLVHPLLLSHLVHKGGDCGVLLRRLEDQPVAMKRTLKETKTEIQARPHPFCHHPFVVQYLGHPLQPSRSGRVVSRLLSAYRSRFYCCSRPPSCTWLPFLYSCRWCCWCPLNLQLLSP